MPCATGLYLVVWGHVSQKKKKREIERDRCLCARHEDMCGRAVMAPLIPYLCSRLSSVVKFTFRQLYPQEGKIMKTQNNEHGKRFNLLFAYF
jgi:hypothetical protein